MPKFELKKFHKNKGHEGEGFYCELWMDGAYVATVIDEGNGGTPLYQWGSREAREKVHAHIASLPDKQYPAAYGMKAWSVKADEETFICDLVELHHIKKACKKHTCFHLKGQEGTYSELNRPYSPEIAAQLRKEYGDKLLVIYNESLQ
ncbi:MAG: hypothetical protein M0R80_07530 [Proteobacteria bacterium]|jgi:hypothetical protein|nr:hypothetical protein [Pseudomonadota bacterium]